MLSGMEPRSIPNRANSGSSGSNGRGGRGGRILKKLVLSLLGALVLFETVPRFISIPGLDAETLNPGYLLSDGKKAFVPHPYLIFTPKPGYVRDDANKQFSHGASGFRGADVPLAKPEGTLRIACIGGSSTYGTGPKRDESTWPAKLGALLNERHPERPVDVINGGVPSWNSFECLGNLAFRVLPYDPDVVLIYLATNDAEAALWPDPSPDNSHYRVAWPTFRPSPLEATLERSITYLVWRKYATSYLDQRADLGFTGKIVPPGAAGEALRRYEIPPVEGPLPNTGFDSFQRNLVSIVAVARAHGATPVLMTQAIWSPAPDSNHLLHGRARLAAHERMTKIVRAVAAERAVPLIEMKPFIEGLATEQFAASGAQTIFTNNVHLTDEGAGLFAEELANQLTRLGF